MKKFLKSAGILAISLLPNAALAAITVPTVTNMSTRSLDDTVASIINAAAGLLGVVALGIIVYGGFLWMTSGGNEESVGNAKKVMVSGVIGMIIIILSYTVAMFLMGAIT